MVEQPSTQITEDEAKLYDRQIRYSLNLKNGYNINLFLILSTMRFLGSRMTVCLRLWGLDAQKRLRASRVLVIGMGGLGCEVTH